MVQGRYGEWSNRLGVGTLRGTCCRWRHGGALKRATRGFAVGIATGFWSITRETTRNGSSVSPVSLDSVFRTVTLTRAS